MTLSSDEQDPLVFFAALGERKDAEAKKAFPGSTPPRNTTVSVDTSPEEWLNRIPSHEFLVNGEARKFYTIGAIAMALGKSAVTIRSWEAKGWIPSAKFRTPPPRKEQIPGKAQKGKRLYSKDQIVFLAEAFERFIVVPRVPNWDGFRGHIKRQYPNT